MRKRRPSARSPPNPVEDLAESLAEGIVSGHPEMPIFVFEPQDVAAIIDYLESIQDVPSAPPGAAPPQRLRPNPRRKPSRGGCDIARDKRFIPN